jgi:PPOX class probable FMN-dependent enzyme
VATIQNVEQLRAIIGEPSEQVRLKLHSRLNAQAREFIGRSPMFLLSTVDAEGQPSVAPKGDGPGFVRVVDERTLLIPERKGNKLVFSLQNILANPKVGLIFLLPGTGETLRVSGEAELLDDRALCESFVERGKPALLVTRVKVTQAYFHCAKAFLRSQLWDPAAWAEPMKISFGAEIAEEGGLATAAIGEFDAAVKQRYVTDL